MKSFGRVFALGVVFLASAKFAAADTLTGVLNIIGNDTYTAGGAVTFANPAMIGNGTGSFSIYSGNPITIAPNGAFTTTAGLESLSFVVNSVISSMVKSTPAPGFPSSTTLTVNGLGTFTETGPISGVSPASYTFTSQDLNGVNHLTTFSASIGTTPVVPEPSSLLLLGTGLVSSAGMFVRRRSA